MREKDYSEKCNYKFRCTSLSDFELILTLSVKNKYILSVFNRAKSNAFIKAKLQVKGDINVIDRFSVDEARYLPVVRTALNSIINNIYKLVALDKIKILKDDVKEVVFIRTPENEWNIKVTMEGLYVKF